MMYSNVRALQLEVKGLTLTNAINWRCPRAKRARQGDWVGGADNRVPWSKKTSSGTENSLGFRETFSNKVDFVLRCGRKIEIKVAARNFAGIIGKEEAEEAEEEELMGVLEKDEEGLQYVRLGNGRRICYREQGVSGQEAKRQLMVLHGLGSSRLASMPGVSSELLRAYGVRIIAIDRPGYGRSDIDGKQTLKSSTADIEEVADSLQMGEKFWLLGYSGGGSFCWASARYIPHRIAGIAGWAPMGNFFWKGITDEDRKEWMDCCTDTTKLLFSVGHLIPNWVKRLYTRYFVHPGPLWVERVQLKTSEPDKEHLKVHKHIEDLSKDNMESLARNKSYGMYKDLEMWGKDWGFEPADVAHIYKGPFHIWQGTVDNLVPVGLQRWVKNTVPGLVELHELPNEGHLSWFCNNDKSHHEVFETLFGESIQVTGEEDAMEQKGMQEPSQEVENEEQPAQGVSHAAAALNIISH